METETEPLLSNSNENPSPPHRAMTRLLQLFVSNGLLPQGVPMFRVSAKSPRGEDGSHAFAAGLTTHASAFECSCPLVGLTASVSVSVTNASCLG